MLRRGTNQRLIASPQSRCIDKFNEWAKKRFVDTNWMHVNQRMHVLECHQFLKHWTLLKALCKM